MRKTRPLWLSIGFVLLLVVVSLVGFATGALKPTLGLDLEGGVSVILSAPAGTPPDVMDRTLENIRNRVDSVGVGEPQIFVSGNTIEVQLPGLAKGTIDQRSKQQWCLIGQEQSVVGCYADQSAAQAARSSLEVREQVQQVCLASDSLEVSDVCYANQKDADTAIKAITVQPGTGSDSGQFCLQDPSGAVYGCEKTKKAANDTKAAISTTSTSTFCISGGVSNQAAQCFDTQDEAQKAIDAVSVLEEHTQYCVVSSAGKDLGCFLTQPEAQAKLQQTGQGRLLDLIGTTARLEQRQVLETLQPGDPNYAQQQLTCDNDPTTPTPDCPADAKELADKDVWLPGRDDSYKYHLGSVQITGDAIKKAIAQYRQASQSNLNAGWVVGFDLTKDGGKIFGDVTTRLVGQQLAIVLDNQVISAPQIQDPITNGSGEITGSFTKQQADDLATVLNAGALPVQLTRQQVLTVSPTLGEESLHQGIVAGLAGLALLFLYLLFYYRLLGVVAWMGMTIWAILALALISLAGVTVGYALTLAGVAGLVISLGVTADSYIVFFERLKDEVRGGRSPRTAVQPAFKRAYRTIVAADTVTAIAAVVLYITAVSSVRGFALTLGVATLLDLFVVYFFKRPTVFLIARNERLVSMPGFGLTSGVAAEPDETMPEPVPEGAR